MSMPDHPNIFRHLRPSIVTFSVEIFASISHHHSPQIAIARPTLERGNSPELNRRSPTIAPDLSRNGGDTSAIFSTGACVLTTVAFVLGCTWPQFRRLPTYHRPKASTGLEPAHLGSTRLIYETGGDCPAEGISGEIHRAKRSVRVERTIDPFIAYICARNASRSTHSPRLHDADQASQGLVAAPLSRPMSVAGSEWPGTEPGAEGGTISANQSSHMTRWERG